MSNLIDLRELDQKRAHFVESYFMQLSHGIYVSSAYRMNTQEFTRPSIVIQIAAHGERFPPLLKNSHLKGVLQTHFDDPAYVREGAITPTQAEEIITFVNRHWDGIVDIYVHCHQGVSRSPAVAAALMRIFMGAPEYFWFENYRPNGVVYGMIIAAASRLGMLKDGGIK